MLVKEAKKLTGGIGFTQKTGMAYGLPAVVACNVGSKLAGVKGSVCEGCYACAGRYRIPKVITCQNTRLESVKSLGTPETSSFRKWVDAMVLLIDGKNKRLAEENKGYFRWHDSGDLISTMHLEAIAEIARRLPHIKFWVPTKEIEIVREWLKGVEAADSVSFPENLCIRISGYMVDKKAKTVKGLPVSNVHTEKPLGETCPAIEVHSGCGKLGCRKCWDKNVKSVSYKKH